MKIHLLAIEPFEERYTEQWYRWWKDGLEAEGHTVSMIDGVNIEEATEREGGEWLDPTKTWIWKGRQLENLARAFYTKQIQDGDVILSLDFWNPCLTGALYMRDTTGIKVKIGGFYHAGASDPNDFLARMGCRRWGLDVERGWAKGIDFILCGSHFAGMMLRENLSMFENSGSKIYATGYPINKEELLDKANFVEWSKRDRIVVFPHRLAPEKQPELFEELKNKYLQKYGDDGTIFVRSRDVCSNKKEYYDLLAKSKVSFSAAKQETFGIAQQEAACLGAWLVNPLCCSYPEVSRGSGVFYKPYDIDEAASLVHELLETKKTEAFYSEWNSNAVKRASKVMMNGSTLLPIDYIDRGLVETYYDFWKGRYDDKETVFINKLPQDVTAKAHFSQINWKSIDQIYFTGSYDFSSCEHRSYFYHMESLKRYKIVVARNYGEHNCLWWREILGQYKEKIKIIHKLHFDQKYDAVGELEVGEPFKLVSYTKHGRKQKKYDYGKW